MSAPDNCEVPLVPSAFRSRLRETHAWSIPAVLEYVMRHPEFTTYVEALFHAEQYDGCPRDQSDAFISAIDDLACVVANGKPDTAGIRHSVWSRADASMAGTRGSSTSVDSRPSIEPCATTASSSG